MMDRRTFINQSLLTTFSLATPVWAGKDLIIGHGDYKYKVDHKWGVRHTKNITVKDCHEMVIDSHGRIILLTNEVKNNIIIYNKDGKLLETWTLNLPGAHGLTINNEGGEDFLYITDSELPKVVKTTLKGKVVKEFPTSIEIEYDEILFPYKPTETAIASNGDVYVADGYGSQLIAQYDQNGVLQNLFGGIGDDENQFQNAHGITIDTRDGTERLLITARMQNKLKYFSLDGIYQSSIDLPGAYICRPVIDGDEIYTATIWSHDGSSGTGFVSILDKNDKLVSAPGGCFPRYKNRKLDPMFQTKQVFQHPHDVCVDKDKNLYVCQWNAGNVFPYKLLRV